MKRLALVLMLLTLPFTAQAQEYETTTTLSCKSFNEVMETFVLDAEWSIGGYIHEGWTVTWLHQFKYSVEVHLEGPEGQKLNIDFNNGWPCRVETKRKPIQAESDNFNQID